MKKIFKKNQIIVSALAILLLVAGYLSYADQNFNTASEKEKQVEAANEIYESTYADDDMLTGDDDIVSLDETDESVPGEAVVASNNMSSFMIQAKLNREQTRSKSKETLQEIINNESLSNKQKKSAVKAMVSITERTELENTIETLLSAKGYENIVVTISEEQADVVINENEITDEVRAQIEDVVKRKTGFNAEQIVITPAK